jgi:hypothetical protein
LIQKENIMNEADMALATKQLHDQHDALASVIIIVEKKDGASTGASVGCLLPPGFEYHDQLADTLEAVAGHVRVRGLLETLLS